MANPAFSAVVVGGGAVGAAVALALVRRGLKVTLVEACDELARGATSAPCGVLRTGFDLPPDALETRLVRRAAELRDGVLDALGVPVLRCGAVMADAPVTAAANATRNGVEVGARRDGALVVPGEAVTDPVGCTLAFAGAAQAAGAEVRTGFRVRHIGRGGIVISERDEVVVGDVVVDCAGPGETEAEELLVFDVRLDRVLLGADGSFVAPTLDGRVVAAPEAVALHPPLAGLEPVATWAGESRTGGYVLRGSRTTPGLVHALASGHTGLSAALAIAEHVADMVAPGRREAPLVAA